MDDRRATRLSAKGPHFSFRRTIQSVLGLVWWMFCTLDAPAYDSLVLPTAPKAKPTGYTYFRNICYQNHCIRSERQATRAISRGSRPHALMKTTIRWYVFRLISALQHLIALIYSHLYMLYADNSRLANGLQHSRVDSLRTSRLQFQVHAVLLRLCHFKMSFNFSVAPGVVGDGALVISKQSRLQTRYELAALTRFGLLRSHSRRKRAGVS